jgi:hypothetical protein
MVERDLFPCDKLCAQEISLGTINEFVEGKGSVGFGGGRARWLLVGLVKYVSNCKHYSE